MLDKQLLSKIFVDLIIVICCGIIIYLLCRYAKWLWWTNPQAQGARISYERARNEYYYMRRNPELEERIRREEMIKKYGPDYYGMNYSLVMPAVEKRMHEANCITKHEFYKAQQEVYAFENENIQPHRYTLGAPEYFSQLIAKDREEGKVCVHEDYRLSNRYPK